MAVLTGTTIVAHDGEPVVLYAGDELPGWATKLVGDHLLTEDAEPEDAEPAEKAPAS